MRDPMPTIKLRGEGWLALPAEFRRKLKLQSGDELEAELKSGTIVLRPRAKGTAAPREEEPAGVAREVLVEAVVPAPEAPPEPPPPQPKRRGRPPKVRQET